MAAINFIHQNMILVNLLWIIDLALFQHQIWFGWYKLLIHRIRREVKERADRQAAGGKQNVESECFHMWLRNHLHRTLWPERLKYTVLKQISTGEWNSGFVTLATREYAYACVLPVSLFQLINTVTLLTLYVGQILSECQNSELDTILLQTLADS